MTENSASNDTTPVQLGGDDKYLVDVFKPPKAIPTPKEWLEAIKGAVKGKMLAKMKKEAVNCPVKLKVVSFVECFTCPNFNRRVRKGGLQRTTVTSQVELSPKNHVISGR